MTERVKRMKESLRVNKYPLCVEQFRLAVQSLEETAGQPMLLRRSKLHAHVLDNIPIFIEEDDLLCGSGASKPFGLEMQYEYGVWTPDEVESLKSEIYTISPERIVLGGGVMNQQQLLPLIRAEVNRQLGGYIKGKGLNDLDSYIVSSSLGGRQGIMGCLRLAADALEEVQHGS